MTTPQHRIAQAYGYTLDEALHASGFDRKGNRKQVRAAIIYISWSKMKAHEYNKWREENNIDLNAHNRLIGQLRSIWANNSAFKKIVTDCTRIWNGEPTLAEMEA